MDERLTFPLPIDDDWKSDRAQSPRMAVLLSGDIVGFFQEIGDRLMSKCRGWLHCVMANGFDLEGLCRRW